MCSIRAFTLVSFIVFIRELEDVLHSAVIDKREVRLIKPHDQLMYTGDQRRS